MAGKRELIEPNEGDKRFVRRDEEGKFTESVDVGRSLSQDRKREAENEAEPGQGDRGDRKASDSEGANEGSSGSSSEGKR
jgi:hypothetical protein